MTVNTTRITSGPYIGNGIADTFSYAFRIEDKTQLDVYETTDQGVEALLTVDTDYTVTGVGVDQGGTVTRVSGALPTDYTFYIRSNYQKTQLTAFQSQGAFFPDLHENAMDQLTFLIQQVCDGLDRSPRLSDSFTGVLPLSLESPIANAILRWKSDLTGFENAQVKEIDSGVIFSDGVIQSSPTVAAWKASTPVVIGEIYRLKDRGYNLFEVTTGESSDGKSIIQHGTLDVQLKLFETDIINVSSFGVDNNISNLDDAVQYAKSVGAQKVVCDISEIRVSDPGRSQGTYSTYETWNFSLNIDGFDGEIDLSPCTFYVDPWVTSNTRITVLTITRCTGVLRLPKVLGQLSQHNLGSAYIDDCFVRIGGGCKKMTIHNDRLITGYPGFGVLVRHYTEDTNAVDLSTDVPTDIDAIGRGGIINSWQSGFTTVTGYNITATLSTGLNGNNSTLNSQQSTTGHGIHFEAVTNGSINPYVDNQKAINCKSTYNRLNGIMFHTAISNYQALNNYSAFNQQHGAEYQAFCDGLVSFGNVYERNNGKGMLVGLSTATWKGSETKNSNATIHDTIQFNDGIGFDDLSHGVNLTLSGTIKRCTGGGYFAADGTENNRNVLTNLTIADCGRNANPPVYAATITTEILSDVKIVNSDHTIYRQIPFRLKTGRSKMGANITIIGESADGTDFDTDFEQPSRLPLVDTSVRMRGDLATIVNGSVKINAKGAGEWLLPTGFLSMSLSNVGGTFPSYKLTESASLDLLGTEFTIHNDGTNTATLTLRDGTINTLGSLALAPATSYRVRYTSLNDATITLL